MPKSALPINWESFFYDSILLRRVEDELANGSNKRWGILKVKAG